MPRAVKLSIANRGNVVIHRKEHGLLFFKPKKTAGTSVEIALSCNAGPDDIVTPILPVEEAKRHGLGGQFPANWGLDRCG